MVRAGERRRVLVATAVLHPMQELFAQESLHRWDLLEADSFSLARFTLQHNPCDVLVIDDDLLQHEGYQGMAWLAWQRRVPMVYLSGASPERYARAMELGISQCLPRVMAFAQPALLDRALEQAMNVFEAQAGQQRLRQQLGQTRKHVDRLVSLLWRTSPRQGETHWYPQRHMLERLQEELARTERHKIPLTVAVGEVTPSTKQPEPAPLPDWSADVIVRTKRRCDVAGQYGPQGFMLLMVQTPRNGGLECCKRLQQFLEHPAETGQGPHEAVRAFFGLASTVGEQNSPQVILRLAEQSLEAARASTHDRIVVA